MTAATMGHDEGHDTVQGRALAAVISALTAAVPFEHYKFRQQGKPKPANQGGGVIAQFVTYIEAGFVRQRLDELVPGRWTFRTRELPTPIKDKASGESVVAVHGSLEILLDSGLSIVREDYGQGSDYQGAATDAFKRAAVRWGIGGELYDLPKVWVKVDTSNPKYTKPLEEPRDVLRKKMRRSEPLREQAPRETKAQVSADRKPEQQFNPSAQAQVERLDLCRDLRLLMRRKEWTDSERDALELWFEKKPRSTVEVRTKLDGAKAESQRRIAAARRAS